MINDLDQIFVTLKHWLVGLVPEPFQPVVAAVISIAAIIGVFATLFAITTILERKGLGRIQNRYGPNRVGPFGFLQPAADGIKAIIKEDLVPRNADKIVNYLAPLALVVPSFLVYSVLPIGRNMVLTDFDAGVLYFFAIGAGTELAVFMAGWSSRNKYSMLGAMRAIAQMISYEVPLVLSTIPVLMMVGSLSLDAIVAAQAPGTGYWYIFTPWGIAGFVLFIIAANAETNRSPFDMPEAESEIIAGFLTEYSGFKYALFFMGEYLGLFAATGLGVTLFLGGWQAPVKALGFIPSWLWFFGKQATLVIFFIWVRATLPRLRLDQLLAMAWKFLVPLALVNMVVAALWHLLGQWNSSAVVWGLRWGMGAAVIAATFYALARILNGGKVAPRKYRYAQ